MVCAFAYVHKSFQSQARNVDKNDRNTEKEGERSVKEEGRREKKLRGGRGMRTTQLFM